MANQNVRRTTLSVAKPKKICPRHAEAISHAYGNFHVFYIEHPLILKEIYL